MKPIIVLTEYRGVFFGYVNPDDDYKKELPNSIELKNARMCVYWSQNTKGVLGLASTGPQDGCKITLPVPALTAWKITAVLDCTPEAQEKWEQGLWK